jgi:hypothetical protein
MADQQRVIPANDLDFNLMTTEPQWGREVLPDGIRDRARRVTVFVDRQTNETVREEVLDQWSVGALSTRDVRFGNLAVFNGEMEFCRHHQDFAMDSFRAFLEDDDSGHASGAPFVAINRTENQIELSHSKGGWFRKLMNTFTTETTHEDRTPPKKDWMGRTKAMGG